MQYVSPIVSTSPSQQIVPSCARKDRDVNYTVIGGTGAVAGGTLANGQKVLNGLERVKILKGQNKENIMKLLSKSKFFKVFNNPVGKKVVGTFAGLSAVLAVVASASEVTKAYNFLDSQS